MNKIVKEENRAIQTGALVSVVAGLALMGAFAVFAPVASATDQRAPEVPDDIAVDAHNKVHFHGFGRGVQIYTWNGTTWGAPVPDATLFDYEGNVVALHSAGPIWVSNSGSLVRGSVIQPTVTMDRDSIPWVKLKAVEADGPGIFANTTFIQRVNTFGGKEPSTNGVTVGQVASMPYTADYFFYRHSND
jgi:hypothetical protein